VTPVSAPSSRHRLVDDDIGTIIELPHYASLSELVRARSKVRATVREALAPDDALILRSPGVVSPLVAAVARQAGHPYGVEVIGDPARSLARGAIRHPLRPVARWALVRAQRRLCANAQAVLYVARGALEPWYPAPHATTIVDAPVSRLEDVWFREVPERSDDVQRPFVVVTVASLAQPYKRVDVAIDAITRCIEQGCPAQLVVVGDGVQRPALEAQAVARGIADRVSFLGELRTSEVRAQLDQADVFVLVSAAEGMPRALLEAMARGLPCVGTPVGGVPWVLGPDDLVPVGEAHPLATRLLALWRDPSLRRQQRAQSIETAQRYHERVLAPIRREFIEAVRVSSDTTARAQR
jgi:glycosyltransferase involved in cell wall biosynthesis